MVEWMKMVTVLETGHNNNELLAGEGKKITSPASTRILLGIMGEDSGYLTLNQMKAYSIKE